MGRVTDDPIEAAYYGIKVWAMACEKADSFDVNKVRQAVYGLKFPAPGGEKIMDKSNQHTWKPVFIGEIKANGQFKIIKSMKGLVKPDSYSKYLHDPRLPNTDGKYPAPTGGPQPGKTYPQPDLSDDMVTRRHFALVERHDGHLRNIAEETRTCSPSKRSTTPAA